MKANIGDNILKKSFQNLKMYLKTGFLLSLLYKIIGNYHYDIRN